LPCRAREPLPRPVAFCRDRRRNCAIGKRILTKHLLMLMNPDQISHSG
jgi:hypothetical protein